MDLIFAEATPPGRGGISVIRLSGTGARQAAENFVGPMDKPRHTDLREFVDDGELVDSVLSIWFPHGASFTGEEVAELHLHGAPVIVRRANAALLKLGARPAEAGEFTRRAFLHGRMDLAEIEGLGDLLAAETEAQRKLALRTSSGELAQKVAEWRYLLIHAGALVEASVDFADEDVPEEVPSQVFELLEQLRQALTKELHGFSAAERIRMGFEVAIVGPPNSGKSSLLNQFARRDVAIVSEVAGTTRDIIEVRMDISGLAVTILDTAGLREAEDPVEAIGVKRAITRAAQADLRIHLSDHGTPDEQLWEEGDLVVTGKADLSARKIGLSISSLTGEGVDNLVEKVRELLTHRVANAGLISHERQRAELKEALTALEGVDEKAAELVAEAVRAASHSLDRLLGRIGADDYLDVIFSSFCIGK